MISDRDIYASAKILISQYGDDAESFAMDKMFCLIEHDDSKGAAVWISIASAISNLQDIKKQKYLM